MDYLSTDMHYDPGSTRSSLLQKIRDTGDHASWQRFFDQYAAYIHSIARKSRLNENDADDVVQNVLAELAKNADALKYDRTQGRFRAWLTTCAKRRTEDLRRKLHLRQQRETHGLDQNEEQTEFILRQADTGEDAFAAMAEREWRALIRNTALAELKKEISPQHFSLFHARVIEEWDVPKIMQTFGVTRAQVDQAKCRIQPRYTELFTAAALALDSPFAEQ